MPDPYLAPSLVSLRAEINATFPGRDKASDGWIGNRAHQASTSDHNPLPSGLVLAIDVDKDLRDPDATLRDVVDLIHGRCARGIEQRLTYIIYQRKIASASRGWTWRNYTGANAHGEHAHFSASKLSKHVTNTAPWGIKEEFMAGVSADEVRSIIRAELTSFGKVDPLATILVRSKENQARTAVLMAAAGNGVVTPDLARQIADALPEDIASDVADELAKRLGRRPE